MFKMRTRSVCLVGNFIRRPNRNGETNHMSDCLRVIRKSAHAIPRNKLMAGTKFIMSCKSAFARALRKYGATKSSPDRFGSRTASTMNPQNHWKGLRMAIPSGDPVPFHLPMEFEPRPHPPS